MTYRISVGSVSDSVTFELTEMICTSETPTTWTTTRL